MTLTVMSRDKAPNELLPMQKGVIGPTWWKHRVSLVITIEVDQGMARPVNNNRVNLLTGLNPVAVPHILDPGILKVCDSVGKFVPEGLDLDLSQRIVEIMPVKLLIFTVSMSRRLTFEIILCRLGFHETRTQRYACRTGCIEHGLTHGDNVVPFL